MDAIARTAQSCNNQSAASGRMSGRTRTRPIKRAGVARLARRAFIIEPDG
jgi:hypothetical protein